MSNHWSRLVVNECVTQQFGLAFKGLARVAGIFHEGDLLRKEPRNMHGVVIRPFCFSSVHRMISVDVDDGPLTKALWTSFPKVIKAA